MCSSKISITDVIVDKDGSAVQLLTHMRSSVEMAAQRPTLSHKPVQGPLLAQWQTPLCMVTSKVTHLAGPVRAPLQRQRLRCGSSHTHKPSPALQTASTARLGQRPGRTSSSSCSWRPWHPLQQRYAIYDFKTLNSHS